MSFSPFKPRAYGSAKQAVAALFEDAGGVGKVMEILGLSRTRVYALADPDETAQISFDRVAALTQASGASAAAEHLSLLAGGVFMRVEAGEEAGGEGADWHTLLSHASRSNARTISALSDALAQDSDAAQHVSPAEARAIMAELDAQLATLTKARARLSSLLGEG